MINDRMDPINSNPKQNHMKLVIRKRCKYQVRWFYSKGAFLVLLWTTLISATVGSYQFGGRLIIGSHRKNVSIVLMALSCLTCITIPLLGWLADAKLGNYRVFKVSCFFLLVGAIIISINVLCFPMLNSVALQNTSAVITVPVYAVGIASIAVCIMTALQLGLDQMPDASSTNLSSFISWFVFSINLGFWIPELLLYALLYCTHFSNLNRSQLFSFFPVMCLVIICSTMFLLAPKWLIIEPKSPRALKTIYKVLKFAAKHKAPIYRSALTYWEEDVPSRLDLGKTKYGGPFTTEQVENVKTFLRILMISLPILIILSARGYMNPHSFMADSGDVGRLSIEVLHLINSNITACTSSMVYTFSVNPWWSGIVTTVVYEFALYPFIRNKVPSSIRRIGGAALLNLILNILYLAAQFCPHVWGLVLHCVVAFLNGVMFVVILNGMLEFVCAQSPYNMRGLLTGYMMFLLFLSFSLNNFSGLLLFSNHTLYLDHIIRSIYTALSVIGLVLYCLLARWYKRRVRDEDYNAHRVVEEVYDRYLASVTIN
ncbi:solute carrier family 15 member 4-like [Halichondria panicea]|uniref:solute carrier family 15 member 4-like n=1 Tax=Halichondria panicea TaxID=6063 RepID=UPI00312BBD09